MVERNLFANEAHHPEVEPLPLLLIPAKQFG